MYFIALANRRDQHHASARDCDIAGRRLRTTEYVLIEVGDALSKRDQQKLFINLLPYLFASSDVSIEPASPMLFQSGWDLYRRRPDKGPRRADRRFDRRLSL
jgi:hypothetical protein